MRTEQLPVFPTDRTEQIRCKNKGDISSSVSSSGKSLTLSESIFDKSDVLASSGVVTDPRASQGLAASISSKLNVS